MKLLATFASIVLINAASVVGAQQCGTVVECSQRAVEAATTAVAAVEVLLPAGAVVPFNLEQCPAGWTPLSDASGRVIVAASQTIALGSTGGRMDIPSDGQHSHGRHQVADPGFGDDNSDNQYRTDAGGNHNHGGLNMPPYLALTMCQKQ